MSSDETTVKGTRTAYSGHSPVNAIDLMIKNTVKGMVNTAEVVKVVGVDAGGPGAAAGYVDVLPLVCQTDAYNETLPPTTLYRLPYSRCQGGIAALVIDPEAGDTGVAVFAKRDSSGVGQGGAQEPTQPGSFRSFDQGDGFYIGGFLNKIPEIYLELNQDKEAVLHAPQKVTIETKECIINSETATVNASNQATVASPETIIDSPQTRCKGNLWVEGSMSGAGGGPAIFTSGIINQSGGINNTGGIANSGGNITSNNITVETHTHSGVQTGGGNTDSPNAGT
jgi:phage baseplate assembly protein gpV